MLEAMDRASTRVLALDEVHRRLGGSWGFADFAERIVLVGGRQYSISELHRMGCIIEDEWGNIEFKDPFRHGS